MYKLLKPFLFRIDPETAHYLTMRWFRRLMKIPASASAIRSACHFEDPRLEKHIAGLHFKNPVGLAAGFDKDGKYFHLMAALGFSHIEIGTVTPLPQQGNPKPRLFRLVRSRGLINRMGFNNDGAAALAERLKKERPSDLILGANIGKNKDTSNESAVNDYLSCFRTLYSLVDYFTVNVSSPNTPGLRSLQEKKPLIEILSALQNENPESKPIFLKIAPDLSWEQLDEIIEIVKSTGIAGIIATNTTISRKGLTERQSQIEAAGPGGLSGAPLFAQSIAVVKYLKEKSNGQFAVIGVGGIEDLRSAQQYLDAGADLVQIYTGLIYRGPFLVRRILKGLVKVAHLHSH